MISVIIPIYNESDAVKAVILDIIKIMDEGSYNYEIIAVDDKSIDDSLAKVRKVPGIRVLTHDENAGVGAARNTGVKASKGEIIVMIDADGTYPAKAIPKLIEKMDEFDMVIGQRYREVLSPVYLRWIIKGFLNKLVSLLMRKPIKDINSGLRVFKKKLIIPYLDFMPSGHSWVSTSTIIFTGKDYAMQYLPIEYFSRVGRSSFNLFFDGLKSAYCIIRAMRFINKEKNNQA